MINPKKDNHKPRILYVDDESFNLTAFRATFRPYYDIMTSTSPAEAIDYIKQHNVDVIITDQRMPEMTGVNFLKSIIGDQPDAVRLILTGYTDVEAIIMAINECKIFHYVTKPWDEPSLKQVIDNGVKVSYLNTHISDLITKLQNELVHKEKIIGTFQKYVPPEVVTLMLNPENNPQLFEGEQYQISALFVDIRNFMSIATALDPKQTVRYLNKFFTLLSHAVKVRNGTVGKFIGDGMLAFFGAPIVLPEIQKNAVLCAFDIVHAMEEFNHEFCRVLGFETVIGIGINTGPAILGNIGSDQHLEYSAVGDTINVAARIEQLSKPYPNGILISASTYQAISNLITVEKLEPKTVKGKETALDIYRVLSLTSVPLQ